MLSLQKPLGVLRFAMRESDCPGLRVTVTSGEPSLSGPRMQLACGCWALLATLSGCGGYLRWLWTQNFSDLSIWNLSIHLSERAPSFPPWRLMLEGLTESRWHNDMDFILCPKTSPGATNPTVTTEIVRPVIQRQGAVSWLLDGIPLTGWGWALDTSLLDHSLQFH